MAEHKVAQHPSSALTDIGLEEDDRSVTEYEMAAPQPGPVPREVKAKVAAKHAREAARPLPPPRRIQQDDPSLAQAGSMPLPNQQQQAIVSGSGRASTSQAAKSGGTKRKAGVNKPKIVQDEEDEDDQLDATQHAAVAPVPPQKKQKVRTSGEGQ